MSVKLKRLLSELAIILASIYLTFFVDVYTLNTYLKRLFVFFYFIIVCHLLIYLKRRFVGKVHKNTTILSTALAVAIFILFHSFFMPSAQETNISMVAVPCPDGIYREVWLTSADLDGREVPLSQLEIESNQGWTYSPEYDDYVFYPQTDSGNENRLEFHIVAKQLRLTFGMNSWSGSVVVHGAGSETTVADLTHEDSTVENYTFVQDMEREYSLVAFIFYAMGSIVVLAFCISVAWMKFREVYCKSRQAQVKKKNVPYCRLVSPRIVTIVVVLCGLIALFALLYFGMPRAESRLTLLISILVVLLAFEFFSAVYTVRHHALKWRNRCAAILSIILALCMSLMLLYGLPEVLYDNKIIQIEATAKKNLAANSNEVWIMEIRQDGNPLALNDYATNEWSCQNDSVLLHAGQSVAGTLSIPLSHPRNVTISLLSHPWSGIAGIDWGEGMEYHDLYSIETVWDTTTVNFAPALSGQTFGCLALVCILLTAIFYWGFILFRFKGVGALIPAFLLSTALPLGGWFAHWPRHALFALTSVVFLILILSISIVQKSVILAEGEAKRVKKVSVIKLVFFFIISLFQAFLWTYNQFMLSPYEVRGGPSALGFYSVFVVYSCAVGIIILALLKRIHCYRHAREIVAQNVGGRHRKVILFVSIWLVLVIVWLVWWKAYFPATMSPDSLDQWQQAIGIYPLGDAHPLLATLWVRLCSKLWSSPGMVVLMQILLGAALYAAILVSFISRGLSRKIVFILGLMLALLPNVSIYMVTMWKDVPFLLALLSLAFLMQIVFYRQKVNWKISILLVLALFGASLWRHNGFLIAGVCGVVLIIAAVRFRMSRIIAAVLAALVCVQLFNGPLYEKLNVEHYDIGLAGVVTDCVGYTIYYDGEIPQDILEEAVAEKSAEFWRECYSPYHAFNYVYNGEYNLSSIYADKSSVEQLNIVLRLFICNPEIIFYERMAMNDTNLFAYQAIAEDSLNSRFANSIYENDLGFKHQESTLKNTLDGLLYKTSYENPFLDSIFWRNGIMICIALWLLYYNFIEKRAWRNVFMLPMIINYMTLFIALSEQSYRFTHNVIPYVLFAGLCATMPTFIERSDYSGDGKNKLATIENL